MVRFHAASTRIAAQAVPFRYTDPNQYRGSLAGSVMSIGGQHSLSYREAYPKTEQIRQLPIADSARRVLG